MNSAGSHAPLPDALGSVRVLLDAGQNLTDGYAFEGFGSQVSGGGSTPNPYRYVGLFGYYEDQETGLCLLSRRYYDPVAGRFLTRDPIDFGGGDWGLYGYVRNRVTGRVDPDGLLVGIDDGLEVGAALAAYFAANPQALQEVEAGGIAGWEAAVGAAAAVGSGLMAVWGWAKSKLCPSGGNKTPCTITVRCNYHSLDGKEGGRVVATGTGRDGGTATAAAESAANDAIAAMNAEQGRSGTRRAYQKRHCHEIGRSASCG